MGKRTDYAVNFYLKNLQLDKFDKHCEYLHNNELPVRDTYCPDCKIQIYHNNTLNICLCYTCFRTFEREEIIELDPNSKNCECCGKKIMWYSEVCGVCDEKRYKLGYFIKDKMHLTKNKINHLYELIFHYKWSFYEYYDYKKKEQIKQINKIIRSFKSFKKVIENIDVYFDKIKPKDKGKGFIRWKRKCQNNIKYGIKILKKEKRLKQIEK